jgi:hypothetical protein
MASTDALRRSRGFATASSYRRSIPMKSQDQAEIGREPPAAASVTTASLSSADADLDLLRATAPYLSRGNDVTLPKEAAMGGPCGFQSPWF